MFCVFCSVPLCLLQCFTCVVNFFYLLQWFAKHLIKQNKSLNKTLFSAFFCLFKRLASLIQFYVYFNALHFLWFTCFNGLHVLSYAFLSLFKSFPCVHLFFFLIYLLYIIYCVLSLLTYVIYMFFFLTLCFTFPLMHYLFDVLHVLFLA